jgi:DNA-binding CsgD family transcriptional regulator
MARERHQILGRNDELAAVARFLDSSTEWPAAVLIEGAPGIGKTTVWLRGIQAAGLAGLRVLVARPVQADAKMSFTTLGDLLGDVIDDVSRELPEPQRRALDIALLRAGDAAMRPDRRAVSLATAGLLRSVARRGPVLIAIDDVQWIDPASARVLSFALRRVEHVPLGVLAALRTEPGSKDVLDLRGVFTEQGCSTIEMESLSLEAMSHLLRERLPAGLPHTVVSRIHELSDGNPFFAIEIGRALVRRGTLPGPGEPIPVAGDLVALIRARLRDLPSASREVLLLSAAAVRPTIDVIGRALGAPSRSLTNLRVAEEAGMIEIESGLVRFTHPLLASTVYGDTPAQERRSAHKRLAKVVADDEERVRHLALASQGPSEGVAVALEEAAQRAAARGAPDSAAELEALAVQLTPPLAQTTRDERSIRAAEYRFSAGDARVAQDRLEALIGAMPKGPARARARRALSEMLWNDVRQVRRQIEQAFDDLRDADDQPSARVALLFDAGWIEQMGGDLRAGSQLAHEALDLAETPRDSLVVAEGMALVGYCDFLIGQDTRADLERGIALDSEKGPGSDGFYYSNPRRTLGATLMWSGALDEARIHLEADLEATVARGGLSLLWETLVYLAELELRAGNWDAAARYASEGLEGLDEAGLEQAREVHLWSTALIAAHRGEVDIARAHAIEGLRLAEDHGDVFHIVSNRSVLGFLELSLGDPAAAHGWMAPLPELTDRWGLREPGAFPFLADAIEALIALGDVEAAAALLERLESEGRASERVLALATAARCRALLAAAAGDLDGGVAAVHESLELHERLPQPFDLARTLLVSGQIQRRLARKADARGHLLQALSIFERLGAPLWAARARDDLRRIGGRRSSAGSLTLAERRIAELVREGNTDKEIAASLFITPKTVGTQLSRIYRKVGVRSRTELAVVLSDDDASAGSPAKQ